MTRTCKSAAQCSVLAATLLALPAWAGPPYITDDPEPTDTGEGASVRDGRDGSAGIDFNYGAAENLQLTATLPIAWTAPAGGSAATYYLTRASRVWLFWIALILTRPLGATLGDFFDKPIAQGGLDISRPLASGILAVAIIVLILVLPQRAAEHPGHAVDPGG